MNDEWPSKIRHRANYVPGFCYMLVEGNAPAKCQRLVHAWERARIEQFHSLVGSAVYEFGKCDKIDFARHVRLLSDIGHGPFALVRGLYIDLCGRRNFDARWELRRTNFLKKRSSLKDYAPILFNS